MGKTSQYPQLNNRDWLYQRYVAEKVDAVHIGKEIGCHRNAVTRALKRFGIPTVRRGPGDRKIPLLGDADRLDHEVQMKPLRLIASEQGCSYNAVRDAVRRHGIEVPHRDSYRLVVDKSEAVKASLKARYPEGRTGRQAGNWRGGRLVRGGYIKLHRVLVEERWPDHPRLVHPDWTYCQEHILVMEAQLGRRLHEGERVHHINHDKLDNRPENLELKTSQGQHVRDHHAEGKLAAKYRQMLINAGIDPDGTTP